jgi:hypothetical protein
MMVIIALVCISIALGEKKEGYSADWFVLGTVRYVLYA